MVVMSGALIASATWPSGRTRYAAVRSKPTFFAASVKRKTVQLQLHRRGAIKESVLHAFEGM